MHFYPRLLLGNYVRLKTKCVTCKELQRSFGNMLALRAFLASYIQIPETNGGATETVMAKALLCSKLEPSEANGQVYVKNLLKLFRTLIFHIWKNWK